MVTETKFRSVIHVLAIATLAALAAPLCADDHPTEFRISDTEAIDALVHESFTDSLQVESQTSSAVPLFDDSQAKKFGRYCLPGYLRAGWPHCIARWARPAVCADYEVGYVGGGSHFLGESRCRHEGTFGMDYSGWLYPRKTWLKWSHGGRYQGGEGAYATDGPKLRE